MKKQISIIVPVYNVENVVRQCVDSILNQSYEAFELLLIDDGSTDNSGKICDEYRNMDNRVVVIHQVNSGVSSARNAGINTSKGKCLVFVDSDDMLLPDALETGILDMTKHAADLYVGGYIRNDYLGISNCVMGKSIISHFNNMTEDDIVCLFEHNYISTCCGKIYSRDLVEETRFDTSMKFGEDLKFNIKLMGKDPLLFASDKPFFKYYATDNSLTSHTDEQKCKNVLEIYNVLYGFGLDNKYSIGGAYFRYIDKRWKNDILTLENMILHEDSSIISKYRKIKTLCSDGHLTARLTNMLDQYTTRYAIKPAKLVFSYLVHQIKEKAR